MNFYRDFHRFDWNYAFIHSSKQLEEDNKMAAHKSVIKSHKFHNWFHQTLECVVLRLKLSVNYIFVAIGFVKLLCLDFHF